MQRASTEVVVKQIHPEKINSQSEFWHKSSDWERQDNMVRLLAEHLAGSPDQSSHSLLAQGIGSASKVSLEYQSSGEPYLKLQLPYDRGWASLQLALPKASFIIDDVNRSEGILYTRYEQKNKQKKRRGFIRGVFGFLLLAPSVEEQAGADKYLISASDKENYIQIKISREAGSVLQPNEQAFMLRQILGKIS